MRADLHVHTHFSRDCPMRLEAILRTAVERRLSCLAITDHNTIRGAIETQKMVMQEAVPLRIIVGEEIRTVEGEIIGLFLREEIPRRLSAEETIRRIKDQGGLVYVPHPFDRVRRSRLRGETLLRLAPQVDIVEVFNSRVTFPRDNALAEEFAAHFGLARGGGSDAHVPYEIGRTVVEIAQFETPSEFKNALANGKIVARLSNPLVHFVTTFTKLRRKYLAKR